MKNNEVTNATQTAAVAAQGATVAPEQPSSKKGASPKKGAPNGQKKAKGSKASLGKKTTAKKVPQAKATGDRTSKKASVIAMLQRKGGATLDEIMKATEWQ